MNRMLTNNDTYALVRDINRCFGTRLKSTTATLENSVKTLNKQKPNFEYARLHEYIMQTYNPSEKSKGLASLIYDIAYDKVPMTYSMKKVQGIACTCYSLLVDVAGFEPATGRL